MFVGKARSLPYSAAPESYATWGGSGLTYKPYTRLERLAREKHSSFLRKFVNYGRKKFNNIGPRRWSIWRSWRRWRNLRREIKTGNGNKRRDLKTILIETRERTGVIVKENFFFFSASSFGRTPFDQLTVDQSLIYVVSMKCQSAKWVSTKRYETFFSSFFLLQGKLERLLCVSYFQPSILYWYMYFVLFGFCV